MTPCVTFSCEKECGSEKSQLLNVMGIRSEWLYPSSGYAGSIYNAVQLSLANHSAHLQAYERQSELLSKRFEEEMRREEELERRKLVKRAERELKVYTTGNCQGVGQIGCHGEH